MISSERLALWLADKDSQSGSRLAVQAFLDAWSDAPLLAGLRRELDALEAPTPERIVAIAGGFFDRMDGIQSMIDAMIAASQAEPFFAPPLHPLTSDIHAGVMLVNHPHLSIALGVSGVDMLAAKKARRQGRASIGFIGSWYLSRYIKAGDAVVSLWEAPPVEPGFTAVAAGKCRLAGRRRLKDGDELLIDGSRQSFIVDHAQSDIVYLQAVIAPGAAPLAVEYDSETLSFVGATSTDESSSRVQMMVSLLREMDRTDAVPILRELLASPHFYTRWHIMRELLALDAEAALPDLQRLAAEDPHPEVRAAARQTLQLFFDAGDRAGDDPQEAEACRA